MKHTLLASVAALALTAASTVAFSQGGSSSGGAAGRKSPPPACRRRERRHKEPGQGARSARRTSNQVIRAEAATGGRFRPAGNACEHRRA